MDSTEDYQSLLEKPITTENMFKQLLTPQQPSCHNIENEVIVYSLASTKNFFFAGNNSGDIWTYFIPDKTFRAYVSSAHQSVVRCILFNKAENLAFSGGDDNTIHIWFHEEGRLTNNGMLTGHDSSVTSLALSSDETLLASGSKDKSIMIWEVESQEYHCDISQLEAPINAVVFLGNNLLIAGDDEGMVKIWRLANNEAKLIRQVEAHSRAITCMQITSDDKLLTGSADYLLSIWDVQEMNRLASYTHDESITALAVTRDNRYVITGCYDSKIRIWPLYELREDTVIVFEGHEADISSLALDPTDSYILSGSVDCCIKIWDLEKKLMEAKTYIGHSDLILDIKLAGNMMISGDREGNTVVWYLNSNKKIDIQPDEADCINCVAVVVEESLALTGSEYGGIKIWDIEKLSVIGEFDHKDSIRCMITDHLQERLISGGDDCTIKVWGIAQGRLQGNLRGHEGHVYCLSLHENNYLLASGSEDCTVRLWNIEQFYPVSVMNGHIAPVRSVCLRSEWFVTGGEDSRCIVWDIKAGQPLETLKLHTKTITQLAILNEILYTTSYDGTLNIWSLREHLLIYHYDLYFPITSLALGFDEIIIGYENTISILPDPIRCLHITVFPRKYGYLFLNYFTQMLRSNSGTIDSYWKDYTLLPFKMNLLHVAAYNGNIKEVKSAIKMGIKLLRNSLGDTPVSICLDRNNRKCADVIIKRLSKYLNTTQPMALRNLENIITRLLVSSLPSLAVLFKGGFPEITENLPSHGKLKRHKKVIVMSESGLIDSKNFLVKTSESEKNMKDEEYIMFRQSNFCMNLELGAKESMQLIRSLSKCNNQEIYATPLIKAILRYKWLQVHWIYRFKGLLYCFYLTILSLHTISSLRDSQTLLLLLTIYNMICILSEILKFLEYRQHYFSIVWNNLDLLRIILFMVYFPTIWNIDFSQLLTTHQFDSYSDSVLITLTIVSWTRSIAYFRIFERTRYLIRMILEIIRDMVPFLWILITATFAFAMVFYISSEYSVSLADSFYHTYRLNYSDFDTDDYSSKQWFVFLTATFFNPLVLLNLLIAIMGDTYDRVQSGQEVADAKEISEMIIEAEAILFWKRSTVQKKYLQMCSVLDGTAGNASEWSGKVKALKNEIRKLGKRLKLTDGKIMRIGDSMTNTKSSFGNSGLLRNFLESLEKNVMGMSEDLKAMKQEFSGFKTNVDVRLEEVKEDVVASKEETLERLEIKYKNLLEAVDVMKDVRR